MNDDFIIGWIGNSIFILAQLIQIVHTYRLKSAKDISYGLQGLWLAGNGLYTVYGYMEKSNVIFIGNLATCVTTFTNIAQKVYYDNLYIKREYDHI